MARPRTAEDVVARAFDGPESEPRGAFDARAGGDRGDHRVSFRGDERMNFTDPTLGENNPFLVDDEPGLPRLPEDDERMGIWVRVSIGGEDDRENIARLDPRLGYQPIRIDELAGLDGFSDLVNLETKGALAGGILPAGCIRIRDVVAMWVNKHRMRQLRYAEQVRADEAMQSTKRNIYDQMRAGGRGAAISVKDHEGGAHRPVRVASETL